jgi:hypothetical protein
MLEARRASSQSRFILATAPARCNFLQRYAIVRRHFADGYKQSRMKRALLVIMVGALYVLHQDFWFWRTANPLVFGFLPVGLFYHACYTIAVALMLWLMVSKAWPTELEEKASEAERERGGASMDRPVAPPLPVDRYEEGKQA